MSQLKYQRLFDQLQQQVSQLLAQDKLGEVLLKRYAKPHVRAPTARCTSTCRS
jgi:hypothetical protein